MSSQASGLPHTWEKMMEKINSVVRNPVVPDDFQVVLQQMRSNRDPRLAAVFHVAKLNGWTLRSLGDAVGVSRERVRQMIARLDFDASVPLPEVPSAPRREPPATKPPKPVVRVEPGVAEKLREMQRIAAKVNGATPADDPARQVSEEFTAALDAAIRQGVTIAELARTLDVAYHTITHRLARHGYRRGAPSQDHNAYKGHPAGPQEECGYGHPLSGDNLYVAPNGTRACRICNRRRQQESRGRKRRASANHG
ncbi:hypothetical protein [Streptomyces mirabilis]|uniref:hypothetical protein n=1 Tax=Streptomyces mirabilis TaxID=68239 RepID=UPI0033C7953A